MPLCQSYLGVNIPHSFYKKAGITKDDFQDVFQQGHDGWFMIKKLLEQGATASPPNFFNEFLNQMKFKAKPQDLVFIEKPSRLTDSNSNLIASWE